MPCPVSELGAIRVRLGADDGLKRHDEGLKRGGKGRIRGEVVILKRN